MTATNQDTTSAIATTANSEKVYSPAELAAKPTGTNPAMVTKRAGQHGNGIGPEGERCRIDDAVALRKPAERRVGRGHCIVDQQSKRDDERAERYPLHVDAGQLHEREDDGERQRNGERNDQVRANAEANETHHENDRHGLPKRRHEVGDGVLDRHRLIGDQDGLNTHRQIGGDSSPWPW